MRGQFGGGRADFIGSLDGELTAVARIVQREFAGIVALTTRLVDIGYAVFGTANALDEERRVRAAAGTATAATTAVAVAAGRIGIVVRSGNARQA